MYRTNLSNPPLNPPSYLFSSLKSPPFPSLPLTMLNLFILLLFSPSSTYSKPTTLPSEPQAILKFKHFADIHNNLHFNTTVTHCQWHGVTCSNNKVIRLVIEDANLGGVFTANSLTVLDQLRVLSLKNNSLTGHVPDMSGLLNLKVLYLHFNRFTGGLPQSVKTLHRIRTVDLSHNQLTGELPTWLVQLNKLYYLRVDFNRFTGNIPQFNQSTLLVFNVSSNNLSGAIPVTTTLSRFSPSCFLHNRGLCGKIVRRECRPGTPFFGAPVGLPGPRLHPTMPPAVALGQHSGEVHGDGLSERSHHRHLHKTALIVGFMIGVILLIVSGICFTMAVKKQRRGDNYIMGTMESDHSAAINAAAIMRLEEEREEKVKSAQQQVQQGNIVKGLEKGGTLVFCAGEKEAYTVDQLMRASAELLGRGTIGTAYKAVLDNNLIVCVKRIDVGKMEGVEEEVFQRHMESVGALRHPNLVPLRCFFQAKDERLLVYDYQPNGSLFSLIHGTKSARAKPLHWTSCLKIAEDIAQGLSYIHQAWRLVHGDLKSTNVLLGSDFEACLTDYCLNVLTGSSFPEEDPNLNGYKAPEIRKSNSEATPKSDVYAYGVLLLELLTGKPPSEHPGLTPKDVAQWVRAARDVEGGGTDENRLAMLLEVAIACSTATPDHRPNMWQVLKMLQEIKEAALLDVPELSPEHGTP